jgi:thymidylate synthase
MNNIDKQYQALLQDILDNGVTKQDRTGTGTISVFGRQIRHKMSDGFPLLTTKKMYMKGIVTELLWFLRGDTNIKYLVDNDCHIWDGDAYKRYWFNWRPIKEDCGEDLTPYIQKEFIERIKTDDEFAKKWGELGPIYGKQWRDWKGFHEGQHDILKVVYGTEGREHYLVGIDQIANLINDLKTNPDSRRLMVNAWNVGELDQMVLPPCHYGFQVYTRELSWQERFDIHKKYITEDKLDLLFEFATNENLDSLGVPKRAISLMWNQRSVDTFLGLPFNIASYGLLLEIIAKEVNMVPDELIGNLGDVHLYLNHIEQAKEQIGRELTEEERYNIWFNNNYETGMERNFDPNNLPDYDDPYYNPTPKRTREPYPLPKLIINENNKLRVGGGIFTYVNTDFTLENYQLHPSIKAPLSN